MLRYTFVFALGVLGCAVMYETVWVERTKVAVLLDGSHYQGDYKEGVMHGDGTLIWPDDVVYRGAFQNGRMTGEGSLEDPHLQHRYQGQFKNGLYHGQGEFNGDDLHYKGEFVAGKFEGDGELTLENGDRYTGQFSQGKMHGKGRYAVENSGTYEGEFVEDSFTGEGMLTTANGKVYKGLFVDWNAHGAGEIRSTDGERWIGSFQDHSLEGDGEYYSGDGLHYKGQFSRNRYHGEGVLTLANGDRYEGGFRWGRYEGPGVLQLKDPLDGPSTLSGIWDGGELIEADNDTPYNTRSVISETTLYNQNQLLKSQQAQLVRGKPGQIDMYFLGLAGYGSEAVFRREILFSKQFFEQTMGAAGRALALINDRSTIEQYPLATQTSLQGSLDAIASTMNIDEDILFLFLSSHGSSEHEFALQQPGMILRDLSAEALSTALESAGIRWKVVVVSSCYSGGHIKTLENENTLVITASAADKTSFGCDNAAAFTYFGEAYFKNSLPSASSFVEAFEKAKIEVSQREATQDYEQSEPQISKGAAILAQLRQWRAQSGD